jgi:AcrR family transcriptional regulator
MVKSQSELEDTEPLPRGRHGLSADEVASHQRERLIAAIASAITRYGYSGLTIERVIELAGVSRATFYVHFRDKQEAVLAVHALTFERFLASLDAACADQSEWPLKVKSAIAATVDFAADRPEQTQVLSSGALATDGALAERVFASHDHLASLLSGIRDDSHQAAALPSCTEQFLIAAIAAVVARCLLDGEAARLREMQSQLVELTLLPFYGASEAARLSRQPS